MLELKRTVRYEWFAPLSFDRSELKNANREENHEPHTKKCGRLAFQQNIRWQDLANLIEGSHDAHGLAFEGNAETVRKGYDRLVNNFPRIYELWSGFDWKRSFGLGPKPAVGHATELNGPLERLMRRFPPTTKKELPTKPH